MQVFSPVSRNIIIDFTVCTQGAYTFAKEKEPRRRSEETGFSKEEGKHGRMSDCNASRGGGGACFSQDNSDMNKKKGCLGENN